MYYQIRIYSLFIILFLLITMGCNPSDHLLFNGVDFTGWKLFVADSTINVNDVWTVKDGVIHCIGVPNGYMQTEEEYSNYIIELDWRWVEKESNSGVLLHTYGPDQIWPNCIECQLMANNAGDFVLIGDETITAQDSVYANNGKRYVVIPKMKDSNEKPIGEWNHYKIICKENTITCYINGLRQNRGTNTSISNGKICLQSEGGPIEFKNISLLPI